MAAVGEGASLGWFFVAGCFAAALWLLATAAEGDAAGCCGEGVDVGGAAGAVTVATCSGVFFCGLRWAACRVVFATIGWAGLLVVCLEIARASATAAGLGVGWLVGCCLAIFRLVSARSILLAVGSAASVAAFFTDGLGEASTATVRGSGRSFGEDFFTAGDDAEASGVGVDCDRFWAKLGVGCCSIVAGSWALSRAGLLGSVDLRSVVVVWACKFEEARGCAWAGCGVVVARVATSVGRLWRLILAGVLLAFGADCCDVAALIG